ncbi:hypothetical protein [Hydrogenophaga sp. OTU3427]|uniref:hypothetical protein n=1 Tax=Hydrogenophaga sp. OTU3427 TaxID=3043856 RepID=UPI00313D49AF
MISRAFVFAAVLSLGLPAWAQHKPQEVQEDIERHQQMAAAHTAAAQCLKAGTKPDDCAKALQNACKGLALGKFCGMRHGH